MPVGPFLSHDDGFKSLLGSLDWLTDPFYAVLATTSETTGLDRATGVDYGDIAAEVAGGGDYAPTAIATPGVAVNSTKVRFTCAKINFGAEVTITARYLFILAGNYSSPQSTDLIIGHIDLDGTGNISSVAAEFSFTPSATNGLFEIERTAAPA